MTPVIISPETTDADPIRYLAVARHGAISSHGKTAGEALDALTAQLPEAERDFVFVVQQQTRPDAFFGEAEISRLRDLMARANAGETLTEAQTAERFALIESEIRASAKRAATIYSAS